MAARRALASRCSRRHGARLPLLAQPQHIYAADPDITDKEPSQRPYETVTAVAAKLGLKINKKHKKNDFPAMVKDAVAEDGVVLISWRTRISRCSTATAIPASASAS